MPTAQPTSPKAPKATARIEAVVSIRCCGSWNSDANIDDVEVAAASGGKQLAKAVCDLCGSEYLFGVIARTREESLASEVFEHVADEELDELGVDKKDFDAPPDELRMCAKCDGDARGEDWCGGCKEFVCRGCREFNPVRPARHVVEAHWVPPSEQTEVAAATAATELDDDGSRLTGEDAFVPEEF